MRPDTTVPNPADAAAPTLEEMAVSTFDRWHIDALVREWCSTPAYSSVAPHLLDGLCHTIRIRLDRADHALARSPAVAPRVPAGVVNIRPEVAAFALLMERELRANDHKGGWKEDDPTNLAHRVCEEADELHEVAASYEVACLSPVPEPFKSRVGSEAADVANMAMMVADVCGCLDGIGVGAPRLTLNEWAAKCHRDQAKWWMDPATGDLVQRNDGELLMLMVSEIAEAMEGIRKNLMDDKLPHRRMVEVEMADLFIRMMDFVGARGLDLDGAVAEKTAFNAVRKDHTFEARLAANGKKF